MKPITEEEVQEFKIEFERREKFLYDHGWHSIFKPANDPTGKTVDVKVWYDPVKDKTYPYAEAYDQLTMIVLKEHGWKAIVELLHIGEKNSAKIETWGRFQSPFTNRIYSFNEAQHIMEHNWSEDIFPNECSESTRLRNRLVGDNFQGAEIKTWYYVENNKTVFRLWIDD